MNEQQSRRVQKLMKVNMKSEHPPELIIKFVNDSIMLDSRINGMSDKEVIDVLIAKEEHEAKSVGVMFHILTCGENQELFSRMIRYINGGGVDYWHTILCNMNMALFELWTFIHWTCKEQLMRLIREGVRQNVKQIENVVMSAFRTTISSSDFVTKTRILNYLSSIIREHDMWFKSQKSCSALVSTILTSVSHAIVSSPAPLTKDDVFRENMTNFVHFVIKTRKPDCATLGRDFLLILIKLGKLPQIEDIWKDLAQNPSSYGVSGIADYMSKPNMLQQLRLSVELMRRIEFMVHHGGKNLQIYFSWLTNKFLRSNDGVGVRAECVRFLMSMQLDPAKLPAIVFENRVQLLHLLIATCQPGPDQQWLKLCLFLDWFGCDERTPMNFNNIDVPLNVIRHSLFLQAPPPHQSSLIQGSHCSHFANSLLEFVCKSVDVILPIIAPQIRKNVNNAMRGCRDRMQHNFSQILDNHKIDRRVTDLLRSVFPDLVRNSSSVLTTAPAKQKKRIVEEKSTVPPPQETDEAVRVLPSTEKNLEKKNEKARIRKEKEQDENENDLNTSMKLLKGELKEKMEVFRNQWKESDENADKCEALENILNTILNSDENLDDTQQELAAQCLLGIMGSVVVDEKSLLPENEKDFSDSFTHPIYYFLRILCYPPDDDDSASEIMTNLMSAMREKDSTLTYVFLYFIKGTGTRLKDCIECYREVARVSDRGVDEMLASDLQMCAINDSRLFAYLLPFVFSHFEEDVMQSPELLQTLCSNLDAVQLRSFVSDVIRCSHMVESGACQSIGNAASDRVQRAYDDKHTYHIKVINSSARRIGYGIKTTNMKRLGVDPLRGVLDPKEAVSPSSGPTLRMEPPSSSVASGSSETRDIEIQTSCQNNE
uniref:SOSS complex subunit A homolog n=1 Tax=Caenorhabditis japonica TaxID=281687 RepID=A0A8R1HUS7_CAEJA